MRGRLGRSGGGEHRGRCEGGQSVDGGQGCGRKERRYTLLAAGQGAEAEGGGRRVAPQQGQISSPAGERRRGGGRRGLREGRPRPRREGQGGGWGRLQEKGVQLARTVGEVGDEAGSYRVRGLPVEGAEVPHHLSDTLPEAQGPVVDRQGPRIKVTWERKESLVTQ